MAEKLVISANDIKKYKAIADIHPDRIDPYIREAQVLNLRPLLNEALYYDFLNKFQDTGDSMYSAYQNLLNGTTYTYEGQTIEYLGLKPMMVYYTLARFVVNNQVNFTAYGVAYKRSDESDRLDADSIRVQVNQFREIALAYQNGVKQFLDYNTATYTLYYTLNQSPQKSGLSFFKG